MGFVCEEGGPFRKLPTPALPGSGSRVLRSGADLSFSAPLFARVQAVLARNKAERHLRGGAATRRKYKK